jgi:hypothetical protein
LSIAQIEPNPVHTTSAIHYQVNKAGTSVKLSVFDALGNEVAHLVNAESMGVGSYSATFDGVRLASGSYFVRITDGTTTLTKELVLSK